MPESKDRRRRPREMEQMTLERSGSVFCLTLTGTPHKANVFSLPLVQRLSYLLDQVEAYHSGGSHPCALVMVGQGTRFFSAGFDLQVMQGADPRAKEQLVGATWRVLARLLVFPVPTIAVVNGHAFGLGLFLSLACDHRVMIHEPASKAKVCLPEISIGMPLGRGFARLAQLKLTSNTLRTAALTGKQWTAPEAFQAGIIDALVPRPADGRLVPEQVWKLAESLAPTSKLGNLPLIKMELYGETHTIMMQASYQEESNDEQDDLPNTKSQGRSKL